MSEYDLVVVGCGVAGLSCAVSYLEAEHGDHEPRVAVLEVAPREDRGGASRWTTATLRLTAEEKLDPSWVGTVQELSNGLSDVEYCQRLEHEVPTTVAFLKEHGIELLHHVEATSALGFGTGETDDTTNLVNPNGGGEAIVNALADYVDELDGGEILYETEAVRLALSDEGVVAGVVVRGSDGKLRTLDSEAVVLACGGFEGNAQMLTQYVGPNAVDLKLIAPGVRFNQGAGLRMAIEVGAGTAGQFDMIHAEAVDSRTDRADAVIYGHTFGIVVNEDAQRFFDEGDAPLDAGFERLAFEIWRHQNQTAFFISDQGFMDHPISQWFDTDKDPVTANTVAELADLLGLESEALEHTIAEFNAACSNDELDLSRLDGKHTVGITPPKSNWAKPIDTAPYYAYPLTSAVTFTYGGLKVDTDARVLTSSGVAIPNLFAAGEITGLFYHEYPSATSVLRGLTFGRVAAESFLAAKPVSAVAVS